MAQGRSESNGSYSGHSHTMIYLLLCLNSIQPFTIDPVFPVLFERIIQLLNIVVLRTQLMVLYARYFATFPYRRYVIIIITVTAISRQTRTTDRPARRVFRTIFIDQLSSRGGSV